MTGIVGSHEHTEELLIYAVNSFHFLLRTPQLEQTYTAGDLALAIIRCYDTAPNTGDARVRFIVDFLTRHQDTIFHVTNTEKRKCAG